MSLPVNWERRAAKERDDLDWTIRERILDAIERFASTGQGDVKKLAGRPGEFRMRVGDWRIIFCADASGILILHVATRGQVYK